MKKTIPSRLVARAAQRAERQPFFLAGLLQIYRQLHQLSEMELAEFLDCTREELVRLALCGRPGPDAPRFRMDIERVAGYAGANPRRLARLVREAESSQELARAGRTQAGRTRRGFLMAARDRPKRRAPRADEQQGETNE